MKKTLLILVASITIAGCTTATYTNSSGASLTYKNYFFQKKIGEFSISTNGTVAIKSVENDAVTLVNALSTAISNGIESGVKAAAKP